MNEIYLLVLIVHLLGASIWTGGHLVLAMRVLPAALSARDPQVLLGFEQRFESIGMPALAVQIATGFWLSARLLGWGEGWLDASSPVTHAVWAKLACLAATAALALNARFRVIPKLDAASLPLMGAHIWAVTVLAVGFVALGVLTGRGGL